MMSTNPLSQRIAAIQRKQRAAAKVHLASLTAEQRAKVKAHHAAMTPKQRAIHKAHLKLAATARALLDAHGLTSWRFDIGDDPDFDSPDSKLHGRCWHSMKLIAVNWNLLLQPRDAKQVILHEIAHVLVRRRYGKSGDDDHGPRFTKLARKLGCRTWTAVGQYEHANLLRKFPELARLDGSDDETLRRIRKERETR